MTVNAILRTIALLIILILVSLLSTSCSSMDRGSIGHIRLSKLTGMDLVKAAPACIWNHTCPSTGQFDRVTQVGDIENLK